LQSSVWNVNEPRKSVIYLTHTLWIELHHRENENVNYATLMHLKCHLPVSLKLNSLHVGNSNEGTVITHLYDTVIYKKPRI